MKGLVAELSNAHNGELDRAFRILDGVKEAGADWVKFQAYTPRELVKLRRKPVPWANDPDYDPTPEDLNLYAKGGPAPDPWGSDGWSMYDLYEKAKTPHSWFGPLIRHCDHIELSWFSSVFGLDSLAMLENHNCPIYKLASLDVDQGGFRHHVRQTGKPCICSMPEDHPEIRGVAKLYCPPGYPQPKNYKALRTALATWADGFSYHGTDWKVPAYALKHGAEVVEVHVQLDDEPSELEAGVSLTIGDLAKLVEASE